MGTGKVGSTENVHLAVTVQFAADEFGNFAGFNEIQGKGKWGKGEERWKAE